MVKTDYNEFADDYINTENSLFRTHIETPSFLDVVGSVRHKSVLDLACGIGRYTRIAKVQGATRVVGVDIAQDMIAQARQIEVKRPLGIEYQVCDVAELNYIDSFDIVTAAYLLPYADSEQTLEKMLRAIYNNLKPNGRLIALTINPDDMIEQHFAASEKYNIHLQLNNDPPLYDGTPLEVILRYPAQSREMRLLTYQWSKQAYKHILKKIEFQNYRWHGLRASAEGIRARGVEYWQDYLTHPHLGILECVR